MNDYIAIYKGNDGFYTELPIAPSQSASPSVIEAWQKLHPGETYEPDFFAGACITAQNALPGIQSRTIEQVRIAGVIERNEFVNL